MYIQRMELRNAGESHLRLEEDILCVSESHMDIFAIRRIALRQYFVTQEVVRELSCRKFQAHSFAQGPRVKGQRSNRKFFVVRFVSFPIRGSCAKIGKES